jgi:hypothetical protein
MKLPFMLSLALSLTIMPMLVLAENATTTAASQNTTTTLKAGELLTQCKKAALLKRDKTVKLALKEYVTASQNVTNQAKAAFQKISWYVSSSYRAETKKIQEEKKKAMTPVTIKVNANRRAALLTYEAEAALCDKVYGITSTSTKPVATSTTAR